MRILKSVVALSALLVGLAVQMPAEDNSLYHRLGEMDAIHAVVDDFVERILADSHVNHWFEHVAHDPAEAHSYKEHLANFVCQAAGGPCQYRGKDMVAAHADKHVTPEAFDAVLHHLQETLDHLGVHDHEKHELLQLVSGLKSAIVEHP